MFWDFSGDDMDGHFDGHFDWRCRLAQGPAAGAYGPMHGGDSVVFSVHACLPCIGGSRLAPSLASSMP